MRRLSAREEQILCAVVELHNETGEPVSSAAVSRRLGRGLSPASVRTVMAELERVGLLRARHASSGRIPGERAVQLYALRVIASAQASDVPSLESGPPDRFLRGTARWLADESRATAVLCVPALEAAVLRQIRFVPLGDRALLAVIVTREGLRTERVIDPPSPLADEELERAHDLLDERVAGRTLREVRDDLERELRRAARRLGRERARALWLACQALGATRPDVVVEGEKHLLEHPDLDLDRLRAAFAALRDKGRLIELLDRTLEQNSPAVWVGETSGLPQLRGLALVATPYDAAGALGTVAVLGPARLDFARVASLVYSAARVLSFTLGREAGHC